MLHQHQSLSLSQLLQILGIEDKICFDLKEAAHIIFNDPKHAAYRRMLRWAKSGQIETFKDGSRHFVARKTLDSLL